MNKKKIVTKKKLIKVNDSDLTLRKIGKLSKVKLCNIIEGMFTKTQLINMLIPTVKDQKQHSKLNKILDSIG